MSKRLMTRFEPLIEAAVEKHAQGEEITWEASFGMHPQAGPSIILGVFMPSPIIGDYLTALNVIGPAPKISDEQIEEAVRGGIESLREARTQALQAPPQGPPGHMGTAGNGLSAVVPPGPHEGL
jgi:hypothetical protein